MTIKMRAPTSLYAGLLDTSGFVPSGVNYTPDATGAVNAQNQDVPALAALGFAVVGAGSVNGLLASQLDFTRFKNTDGTTLAATSASGKFGISSTVGTSIGLASEAAEGNTKTDDAIYEYVMPQSYVAGQNITITANVSLTGTGVAGTATLQVKAYKMSNTGAAGANIGPGTTSAIVAAGSDLTAVITGTSLNPGDKLVLEVEVVLQETGGTATLVANINSVRAG